MKLKDFHVVLVQLSLLGVILTFLYTPAFKALINGWWESKAYSHGFLVPLISLYLIWSRRERLRYLDLCPNNSGGILLVLLTGSMLLLGNLSDIILFQELSLVIMIAGLVLLLMGTNYLKALSFPIAYLLFMVPILDAFSSNIHWPLQLFSAKIGTIILHSLGTPAFLESQYIMLPNITLEIAEECSGLRFLISIIAIGIPLVYLTQKTWARKIGLVTLALLIAILANAARVAFVGFWAYHYDQVNTHGPFHIFQGFLVAQIGFIVLFMGAWIFSRIPIRSAKKIETTKPASNNVVSINIGKFNRSWYISIFLLLFLGIYPYVNTIKPIPLKRDLKGFPSAIGAWKGRDINSNEGSDILQIIQKADSKIMRIYHGVSGREIKLYIGYFESQGQGRELINYISRRFHSDAVKIDIPLGREDSVQVNKTMLREGHTPHLALFWYDLNGGIITDPYKAKLTSTLDALLRGRTNGAIVMVSAALDQPDDSQIVEDEKGFTQDLIPILRDYLP